MPDENMHSVLVVDDDITVRKLITHHLKKNNYNVLEATGAGEGFARLEKQKIDLVLCDVTMDEMDGFTFCQKVREDEKYRTLPFIFVTAKNSLEDKSKAMEVGGDDIVTKPFNIDELLLKVRALIRRSDIYKVYGVKENLEKSFSETTPKILLVDDDISLAKLFQYNLNKAGFECEIATGVEHAFKIAKGFIPDIIISDIMMPEIDGFQFREMLLKDRILKSIPFVFLTAKGAEEDILDGYDLGIADYVVKTAGPRVVVAKVTAIIKSLGKEREKIVTELNQAADSMRAKVVPENHPEFAGFTINHWHQPFQGIPGGDFIDYFRIDEDNMAIILGDVMGKKWGAWYFAFAYAGYVRSAMRIVLQATDEYSPSEILQRVNKSVYDDAKISEVFTTLSIVVINNKLLTLKYSGAGDLPIIYKKNSDGNVEKLISNGLLLGFASEGNYSDISVNIDKGDTFIMFTDGIIESRNSDGDQFGSERLINIVKNISADYDVLEEIRKEFQNFTGNKSEDDISLIAIKND